MNIFYSLKYHISSKRFKTCLSMVRGVKVFENYFFKVIVIYSSVPKTIFTEILLEISIFNMQFKDSILTEILN